MTTLKRKISWLLALVTLVLTLPSFIYAEDDEHEISLAVQVLSDLGIMEYDAESYRGDAEIKRKEFIYQIGCLMGVEEQEITLSSFNDVEETDYYAGAAEMAVRRGLISGRGDNNFFPDDKISYIEALKICVSLVGYDKNAEIEGGWPNGYNKIASEIGITLNVKKAQDDDITNDEAAQILYNALHVDMINLTSADYEQAYYDEVEKTPLAYFQNVFKGKGRITKNSRSSYTTLEGAGENCVEIGGVIYNQGEIAADALIGRYVEFYYEENEDEFTLRSLIVNEEKTGALTIDAKDILGANEDLTELRYELEDREKTIKINSTADMIFNGEAYPDWGEAELIPIMGEITLISTDGDKVYDLIDVTSYESMYVQNASPKIIFGMYKTAPYIEELNIYEREAMEVYFIEDGEIELSDTNEISAGVFLRIAESKSGKYLKIYITQEDVSGKVSDINDDGLVMDGAEYKFSEAFKKVIEAGENYELKAGAEYTLHLDIDGTIGAIDKVLTFDKQYGFARKIVMDEELERLIIRIFGSDGVWHSYPVKKKVTINGEKFTDTAAEQELAPLTVIRFKLNADGEITMIETPTEVALDNGEAMDELIKNDKFFKTPLIDNMAYYGNNNQFDSKVILGSNPIVFAVPKNDVNNEEAYKVHGSDFFGSQQGNDVEFYDLDEFRESRVMLVKVEGASTTGLAEILHPFLVEKVEKLCVGTEVTSRVTGYQNGKKWSYNGKDATTFANVQSGDLLQLKYNPEGVAEAYRLCYSWAGQGEELGWTTAASDGAFSSATTIVRGKVERLDQKRGYIAINTGDARRTFRAADNFNTYIYHTKSKKVEIASTSDIIYGDYLVTRWWHLFVRQIIIIRD